MISKSKFVSIREYSSTESPSISDLEARTQAAPVYAFKSKFIVGKKPKFLRSTNHESQQAPINNEDHSRYAIPGSSTTPSKLEYNESTQGFPALESRINNHFSLHTTAGLHFVKDSSIDIKSTESSKMKAACTIVSTQKSNLSDLLRNNMATGIELKPEEFRRLQKASCGLSKPSLLKPRSPNLNANAHIETH